LQIKVTSQSPICDKSVETRHESSNLPMYIYEKTQTDNWWKPEDSLTTGTGVCTQVATGTFCVFPHNQTALLPFEHAVRKLNPTVGVKLRSAAVYAALRPIVRDRDQWSIQIDAKTKIQILDSIHDLPQAEKLAQCGAFLREDLSLVLWSYIDQETIIDSAADFEEKLIKYIWKVRGKPNGQRSYDHNVGDAAHDGNTPAIMWGPHWQYHENSATRSLPNPEMYSNVPHITIQCPVYKESFNAIIVLSIKEAMKTSARQDGTSGVFICDNDLQRQKLIAFYSNHSIGWVARPKHSGKRGKFHRPGKSKKTSNINYGLKLSIMLKFSLMLEKHLQDLLEAGEKDNEATGRCLEDRAMDMAIKEMYEEVGRPKSWAGNGKSLRAGKIIMIIDAGTIVQDDCLDAAGEMGASPESVIIQHEPGRLLCASF
jgi:hypothetical protein